MPVLAGKRILLIVAGGIAAYKSLDLIRRLRERGAGVRTILTAAGAQFVTPLSIAALSEEKVYQDLFSLTDESEMGHIRLSRTADLIVIAPATADLLAKLAHGMADDLASTALLASDKPVLAAPTMNVVMFSNPATQANIATLRARGISFVGPELGDLACGEVGTGRMAEVADIVAAVETHFSRHAPLAGRRALVTSGPTFEPIDPVRFIGNRSSGKQGHAVSAALSRLGAETTLVSGPTAEADPPGVRVVRTQTAAEMLAACEAALPVDVAVFAAAVGDWRPAEPAASKIKKSSGREPPAIRLVENPDILAQVARSGASRPRLVIGFAAETASDDESLIRLAAEKRRAKGCDWILANDASAGGGIFGGARNRVHLITGNGVESWPDMTKNDVAENLAARIAAALAAA